jgi:hypothetical protein
MGVETLNQQILEKPTRQAPFLVAVSKWSSQVNLRRGASTEIEDGVVANGLVLPHLPGQLDRARLIDLSTYGYRCKRTIPVFGDVAPN